ncbi:MAG: formate dehydrogenase accessory sulfurtransferase FdhD [Magnetospiraceae bacterium]
MREFAVKPDTEDSRLFETVTGIDQNGAAITLPVINERPLCIWLNNREIVTAMTIGDHPEYLALGHVLNQGIIGPDHTVTGVEFDETIDVVVVRTAEPTPFEEKAVKRVRTSGCAMGTLFMDVLDALDKVRLPSDIKVKTSWLYSLSRKINTVPSLYLKTGAIHGCALCDGEVPLVYMEDVGRHNAVDKIAGYMHAHGLSGSDKILYTTGRLTSEMIIKTVMMGIPVLFSRSGFTAWGVDLARKTGLTLVGRAKGKRFIVLSGPERLEFDADPNAVPEEPTHVRRKGSTRGTAGGTAGVAS